MISYLSFRKQALVKTKGAKVNLSTSDMKALGLGIIIGVLLGVVLVRALGAKLCEINIGPLKLALACPPAATPALLTCSDYGLQIAAPQSNASVWRTFNVTGAYVNPPPADSILLLLKTPAGDYFPQNKVLIDPGAKTWQGQINLADKDPENGFTVIVAIMGADGHALYNYYNKVGHETDRWPAIEYLTEDILTCDRVSIVHKQ
jgi:hypothetical protein